MDWDRAIREAREQLTLGPRGPMPVYIPDEMWDRYGDEAITASAARMGCVARRYPPSDPRRAMSIPGGLGQGPATYQLPAPPAPSPPAFPPAQRMPRAGPVDARSQARRSVHPGQVEVKTIALVVMTDGRTDYLRQCLATIDHLTGPITELWVHDDTGDDAYRAQLLAEMPGFQPLHEGRRRGFGGAIRRTWEQLLVRSQADLVFHIEQDFVFIRPVDLVAMTQLLMDEPMLAQVALRRQPWWAPSELEAGGVVEANPTAFTDMVDDRGNAWLRHQAFFTTNPGLYRRSLCHRGWPPGRVSESKFGLRLFADGYSCAYWGARDSGIWVEHIGHERVGNGY